jgi:hypothetical protein
MGLSLQRVRALGRATRRDLLRRPGIVLATLAAGALLAVLQDLASATFGGSPGLGHQLGLSTGALFLGLVAGVSGVRCAAADAELGPAPSLAAAPLSWGEYALGRFAGILACVLALLLLLSLFAAYGVFSTGAHGLAAPWTQALAVGGLLFQAAVFAALGMALGAALPLQLAIILIVACVAASRSVVPSLAVLDGSASFLALALPDPGRLDLAREAGFDRPVHAGSALLAWAAAAGYAAALLVAAAWLLGRRESAASP